MYNKKFYLNQELISYILVIVFGLIVFLIIQDPNESFFINYDQEFWNTYNSLLIYSGLEQEKYDEPGHVSYLLFAFYLKLINFLNILEVPTIVQLNEMNNFNDIIQSLILHTRIFGFVINIILTLSIIKIFKKFKAENLIFITLILITSNGFLTHVSQHRVEPLTILMMIIAFFSLLTLLDNDKYKIFKIFLFNFFIILSIINKVQIIFYLPFFILIILHYKNLNFNLIKNIKFISKNKKDLFYFISSTFFVIFLISLRSEQLHSSAYLIVMYLLFLISFFCIIDMNNYNNFSYLFNLSLIFAFFTIYVLVLYFTHGGDKTFWVFFKISKIRGYLGDIKLDQSQDTILWIKNFLEFGILNFKQLITNIFEFQKNNLVILIIILFTIIFRNFKNLWSLNIFIALYLITKFITLFRSNAFYYEIYFDWLILLGLVVFFREHYIKSSLKYLILLIILTPNIYNNLNTKNFNKINSGSYDKQIYCSNDQIYSENGIWNYYSKKINKKQILILCE